jgi:hypothetical protein
MILGVVKTINVTTNDIDLIEFMLGHNEKVAKTMPPSDVRDHMEALHSNLRLTLKEAK